MHNTQDVERCDNVCYFEYRVPCRALSEQIEISRAEDDSVEALCDERHALGAAVSMDGEDEDALGEHVDEVAQDTKDLGRNG